MLSPEGVAQITEHYEEVVAHFEARLEAAQKNLARIGLQHSGQMELNLEGDK